MFQFLTLLMLDGLTVLFAAGAVLCFVFGLKRVKVALRTLQDQFSSSVTILDAVRFSEKIRTRSQDLDASLQTCRDQFLVESIRLVQDRSYSTEELRGVLRARVRAQFDSDMSLVEEMDRRVWVPLVVGILLSVAYVSYALSFGDSVAWNRVCILNFWGIAFSQFGVQVLADKLRVQAQFNRRRNTMVGVAVRSISERVNPYLMTEELNSFLPAPERVDWQSVARSLSRQVPQGESSVREALPHGF